MLASEAIDDTHIIQHDMLIEVYEFTNEGDFHDCFPSFWEKIGHVTGLECPFLHFLEIQILFKEWKSKVAINHLLTNQERVQYHVCASTA